MVSVGIDISKGKSTVCFMKPFGEIVAGPMEVAHTESELLALSKFIHSLNDEAKAVMEATNIYHLPVLTHLQEQHIFTSVINPYQMKQYRIQGLRRVKTDKADAMAIAKYGLDHLENLIEYVCAKDSYRELAVLSSQYRHFMRMHIDSLLNLIHILDYTMPGIKREFDSLKQSTGKDRLSDFVEQYWHYDLIRKKSERQFVESYLKWAQKKGYRTNQNKAVKIYSMAKEGIPTLPADQTTKLLTLQAIAVLKRVDQTLNTILSRMQEIAKAMPEYSVVREMGGVGDVLAVRLIADIGDVRRFHNGKALIAYAGIDAPPYQSGQFTGTKRSMSKRGSSAIRKTGYEVMRSLKSHAEPQDADVYRFILKKEAEGKPKKVAKMAGLNKFLRIYYARVMEVYSC